MLEAYRECLKDVFDLPALVDLSRKVRRREVRLVTVDTKVPSPFSASLLFGYVANYLYDGDAPLAERRAQALSVDQGQLRELMGEAELRELLDAGRPAPSWRRACRVWPRPSGPASPDRVHDLLLRVGDLTVRELAERIEAPVPGERPVPGSHALARSWLAALAAERRVVAVNLAGEERFAAVEDTRAPARRPRHPPAPRPAPGFPRARAPRPARSRSRYARTHGPFAAADVARRFGCGAIARGVGPARAPAEGRVIEGEFRPGGSGREWVSPDVLASLRQRSLAKLRREVAPAEPEALARTMLDWQGIVWPRAARRVAAGPTRSSTWSSSCRGQSFPASDLEGEILAARLPGYRPADLDALCAAGEVVWVGLGSPG